MSAWVANYEISDFFQSKAAQGSLDSAAVHFVRCNQWPQYGTATHEERARLIEEKCFGGSTDSANRAHYGPGDATFLVESFTPERRLQRPEEFLQSWTEGQKPPSSPGVFVADLNGHFVTCLAVHLETTAGEVKPSLIVINTTGTRYMDNPTCAFTFDLVYPPEPTDPASVDGVRHPMHEHPLMGRSSATAMCDICSAIGTAYKCAAGCDWDICTRCFQSAATTTPSPPPSAGVHAPPSAAAAQLLAMGFPDSMVQEALATSGGNVDRALEMLLG